MKKSRDLVVKWFCWNSRASLSALSGVQHLTSPNLSFCCSFRAPGKLLERFYEFFLELWKGRPAVPEKPVTRLSSVAKEHNPAPRRSNGDVEATTGWPSTAAPAKPYCSPKDSERGFWLSFLSKRFAIREKCLVELANWRNLADSDCELERLESLQLAFWRMQTEHNLKV